MRRTALLVLAAACAALLLVFAVTGSKSSAAPLGPATPPVPAQMTSAQLLAQSSSKQREAADFARKAAEAALLRYSTGQGTLEEVVLWSERARNSSLADWKARTVEHRDRMRKLEQEAKKRVAAGSATNIEAAAAGYHRAEAEARETF